LQCIITFGLTLKEAPIYEADRIPGPLPQRTNDPRMLPNSLFRTVIRVAVVSWFHSSPQPGQDQPHKETIVKLCLDMIDALNDFGAALALLVPYLHQELSGYQLYLRDQPAAPFVLFIYYWQTKHSDNVVDFSPFRNISIRAFVEFLDFLVVSNDTIRYSITGVDISDLLAVVYRRYHDV